MTGGSLARYLPVLAWLPRASLAGLGQGRMFVTIDAAAEQFAAGKESR